MSVRNGSQSVMPAELEHRLLLWLSRDHPQEQAVARLEEYRERYQKAAYLAKCRQEAAENFKRQQDKIEGECDHPAAACSITGSGNDDSIVECHICGKILD